MPAPSAKTYGVLTLVESVNRPLPRNASIDHGIECGINLCTFDASWRVHHELAWLRAQGYGAAKLSEERVAIVAQDAAGVGGGRADESPP